MNYHSGQIVRFKQDGSYLGVCYRKSSLARLEWVNGDYLAVTTNYPYYERVTIKKEGVEVPDEINTITLCV